MRKLQLRPLIAAGGRRVRPEKADPVKAQDHKKARTQATLAIAAAVVCSLAIALAPWLRSDLAALAQAVPDSVQPAPFDPLVIPPDAYLKGAWSAVGSWPLIPIHLVLMPDGRVLSYGTDGVGTQTGHSIYDVWDTALGLGGGHLTLPNGTGTDIFCSSQLILPQGGSVFVAGGDNWTGTATTNAGNNNSNLFNYNSNSLARGNNMTRARWYSTSTTLLNGEVYIQGGTGGTDRPEIRGVDGSFRSLSNANTSAFDFMFPRNFVAPNGRIFGLDSAGKMFYVDTSGSGSVTQVSQLASSYTSSNASAAMFAPGRILQFGGNSNGAIVIDINGASPTATPTQSMSSQRRWVTATMLADGKVLATGGSQVDNQLTGVNNIAEIWNPTTGTWTRGHEGALARLYHSTALLLPDATVLVAGGGAPGPLVNLNAEIYYPPYLFTAAGTLAQRPAIANAPQFIDIGKTFRVDLADSTSISRVTLVKTGSVTHSWNMEQRFQELTFLRNGTQLSVQAPTRAALAPPGYYLLFVLDSAGVPSVGRILKIGVASDPNPAITPSLSNPGAQTTALGSSVSLQLTAIDPNGDTLTYSAFGLPPGLTLDAASGAIGGAPTAIGSYGVTATVTDGINVASVNFTWTVTNGAALTLAPLPPLAPVLAGTGLASYTATASNGVNIVYRWDFGDGTQSGWSNLPTATHAFASPGIYNVTVTANDDRGVQVTQAGVQTVYLPLASVRPTASSSLAFEPRPTGNPRLWVVNQDNDSVTVFDAVTNAKLGEIAVGTAPRTIAVAPNGRVWVTNRQSATISVIDPGTLAVASTISLPRASQPYGLAFVPGGAHAFVVLGATGQLVKLDAVSLAQAGSVDVGPNPRHLAIGPGGTVYVSRFITPPLPGESTADVQTPADQGGEVAVVDSGSLSVTGKVILGHSEKDDSENQGRGIPNYLGAAAISPDATQGWVPSKQDNVKRGALRDGTGLNFQNTVRAISSRIVLAGGTEDLAARIDHDNASVASAAVFDQRGVYLFVALETSREVAVISAHGRYQLFRFDVGRAPQALALSADGQRLYVNNFMDRTIGVFDLAPLLSSGVFNVPPLATLSAVASEKLSATVLKGKQLFYDARDTRLARDRYVSCASCHNDGGSDGRVWDLTGFGEGLRNTINLRGRAAGQGFLHWSNNFDEVQDFEGQIRALAGGTGLMSDADFNAGTRSQPLGNPKAGRSADLDALAAYVASLTAFDSSPYRTASGALTSAASAGKALFTSMNCGSCHSGAAFTGSGANTLINIGTIKPSSGSRLGSTLDGIDVPTLRDLWATTPYLHDGSAPTLGAAVRAHNGVSIGDADLGNLVAFLQQIGSDESTAPVNPGNGTGLTGRYYNNTTLSGTAVLTRTEAVNFGWGASSPGSGVNKNNFSVRWIGTIEPPATGIYRFQTVSDDGIRIWVNGVQLINNWTPHSSSTNTSGNVNLLANTRYSITVEFFEASGQAEARLRWLTPGNSTYVAVPVSQLFPK
jgi:YVTN family beta-propeller protein